MRWRVLLLAFASAIPFAGSAAEDPALVTILEGEALLIRASARYALVEGARLQPDDIVEAGKTSFVQVEPSDGARLGFGPGARVLFPARSLGERGASRPARVYALGGWLKLTAPKPGTASPGFASPRIDVRSFTGVVVADLGASSTALFVESGEATVAERQDRVAPVQLSLKAGEFYSRGAEGKSAVAPRPSAEFIARLPKPFRDTLPARADRFREARPPALKAAGEIAYDDVAGWLSAEPPLRRAFVARWRERAPDPAFRAALVKNLRLHPEWDPVLFPEKYEKKAYDPSQRRMR